MTSAKEIRSSFIDFFKDKGHNFVPSSPIVPIGDDTLLFANAGMNQFKDIFLGLKASQCKRAANSQKCLRVSGKHNDLEEVGRDTYHHTFFEMLGNWSFDDYFKAEAIEWAWELLTKVWGINPDLLWATVFEGDKKDGTKPDEEAKKLWAKVTSLPDSRILSCDKKDNFWEMGGVGPCGPCSEIHIDLGPGRCDMQHIPGHKCAVNAGCSRFIELWNLVFIQYNRDENGVLTELPARYIDTGAGLERLTAVMQGKHSNYDTDLFMPIINYLCETTGHVYTSKLESATDIAFRVIADHVRALVFAITDGATPSNEGRGYVMRRLLRRAARFGRELGVHEPFMYKMVPTVVDYMGDAFDEIRSRADYVATVIKSEEESFGRTLDRGIEIFNGAAAKAKKTNSTVIDGEGAFALYDTYGFPLDLTEMMAKEQGLSVDKENFDKLMEQQRQRARAAQKSNSFIMTLSDVELPVTEDLHKYHIDKSQSEIVGFIDENGFKNSGQIGENQKAGIVLEKTCFYAESGGQVGDCGTIKTKAGEFIVENTTKIADCVIHQGKVSKGQLKVGDKVAAVVSADRNSIKKNHTATHLLQWALQKVCGDSVAQQGSLVGPDYLRFDFTCPKALTKEQIKEVEELVREKINAALPITCVEMEKDKAKKLGAMALFGEKYGDVVRVVAIGADSQKQINEAFSTEFCGGTHVDNIGVIGNFKIIKEESISAGVRRITGLTGAGLNEYFQKRSEVIDKLTLLLKVPSEKVLERVAGLIKDNKQLTKQLKSAAKQTGNDILGKARELLEKCEKINGTSIVVSKLEDASAQQGRTAIDMLKKKADSVAIVFGFAEENKVTLLAAVSDDLIKKGLKAGDIVKNIAPIVGGGGGGRPQMAQAGGKDPAKIDEALSTAIEIIKEKLG